MRVTKPLRCAGWIHHGLLLAVVSCWTLVVAPGDACAQPAPPSDAAKTEAMKKYEAGSQAFADKRYKDAIDLFLDADQVVRNADLAFNTALAYEAMGDVSSALRWAREYLRRSPSAEDRPMIEKRIAGFEKRLQDKGIQQLTVLSSPEGATVVIDGRPLGVTPWTGELRPGGHDIVVTLTGYREAKQVFDLRAERAGEVTIGLELAPVVEPSPVIVVAPPGQGESRDAGVDPVVKRGLLGGGITALVLGAGGIGASVALELMRAGAEADARAAEDQVDAADELDTMESYQLGARVAAGAGAALMAAGVAMVVTGTVLRSTDEGGAPQIGLACLPGRSAGVPECAFVVRGAF